MNVSRGILLVVAALAASSAAAQEDKPRTDLVLPQSPLQWINSGPLSVDSLKGKAVFFWFFEEESYTAHDYWQTLLPLAQRYAKDPVIFVGVNSGMPRAAVEQYVRECKITWPVIVDPTREFEEHAGVKQINLRNIYESRVLLPDGTYVWGKYRGIEYTVDEAIKNAKWKIAPKEIPLLLKPVWHDIEFGSHATAATGLKKGLSSTKPEIKAAAEKLHEIAMNDLNEQIAVASQAVENEQRWKAFNLYSQIEDRFKGYPIPETVEKTRKTLAADTTVKEELASMKQYEAAMKQLAAAAGPQRKRAALALEKVVKDKPDTEGAKKAQAAIDRIEAGAGQ